MQKPQTWTVLDALQWTAGYFSSRRIDSPRLTAELLLAEVLKTGRIDLYLRHDQPLSPDELAAYRELIRRRAKREPVAYILEKTEFWGLPFYVTPDVLIPRPETEHLVEAALDRLQADAGGRKRIADLGTGSGAVAVSLASSMPDHHYFAVDRSYPALCLARKNAELNRVSESISFMAGIWLEPFAAKGGVFDMIVSNPPYVASGELSGLQPEISRYEPRLALDGKEDGLAEIRSIAFSAPSRLSSGGHLFIEIGCDQKEAVFDVLSGTGAFEDITVFKDYSGHDRVAAARRT